MYSHRIRNELYHIYHIYVYSYHRNRNTLIPQKQKSISMIHTQIFLCIHIYNSLVAQTVLREVVATCYQHPKFEVLITRCHNSIQQIQSEPRLGRGLHRIRNIYGGLSQEIHCLPQQQTRCYNSTWQKSELQTTILCMSCVYIYKHLLVSLCTDIYIIYTCI